MIKNKEIICPSLSGINSNNDLNIGPLPQTSCGKSPKSRVIGGVDAKPGNWPWQVSINFHVENNVPFVSRLGGG